MCLVVRQDIVYLLLLKLGLRREVGKARSVLGHSIDDERKVLPMQLGLGVVVVEALPLKGGLQQMGLVRLEVRSCELRNQPVQFLVSDKAKCFSIMPA